MRGLGSLVRTDLSAGLMNCFGSGSLESPFSIFSVLRETFRSVGIATGKIKNRLVFEFLILEQLFVRYLMLK